DLYERFELDYLSGDIVFDLTQDSVRSRFHELNYGQPLTFFKRLFKAQQLGVKKWGRQNTNMLKKDDFFGSIKKPLKTKLPITIQKLTLTNGVDSFVEYDDLSDGEAQLLEVLSLVRLFSSDNSKALFLLDEPETHLNPSWRTHFYSYIEDAIDADNEEVQLFISTHSPFMVSSLKRNNVYQFHRENNGLIGMRMVQNETYGASFDVLIKDLFELRSLISQSVIDEIRKQLEQGDSHAREWIEENLGLSAERAYLISRLSQ
ncbi:MAG: AAA family ATPase, partial [Prolixibacteraceae bacterium]|nr:AAA family ATPase [Prolixibacteraceae bacterium]